MFFKDTSTEHSYISPIWNHFIFLRNIQYVLLCLCLRQTKKTNLWTFIQQQSDSERFCEANIEDMDNVSININYSSIVENTCHMSFNLNQDRNSYKRLADLFVMLNGTNSRSRYIYLYDLEELVFRWTLYKSLPISIWNPNPHNLSSACPIQKGSLFLSALMKKIGAYTTDVILFIVLM